MDFDNSPEACARRAAEYAQRQRNENRVNWVALNPKAQQRAAEEEQQRQRNKAEYEAREAQRQAQLAAHPLPESDFMAPVEEAAGGPRAPLLDLSAELREREAQETPFWKDPTRNYSD